MLDAVKLVAERMKLLIELSAGQTEDFFSLEGTVQPADIGWPTENGKKLSNCQAFCLVQLCLGAA